MLGTVLNFLICINIVFPGMDGIGKSGRNPKPTPRYISWRGLRMVTISRDQSRRNHSVPADDSRVLEWVTTKHSTCGLQSLLSSEVDPSGQADIQFQSVTGEQLNMDLHTVAEPDVLGQVDIQSVMQDMREEYGVLCDVTGLSHQQHRI